MEHPYEAPDPVILAPTLSDPWAPTAPVPLDGRLERSKFPPWLTAFMAMFIAWILFQIISSIAAVALLIAKGVGVDGLIEALTVGLDENARELLIANTFGQVLGLALPAWLLARMHSSRRLSFIRLRAPDAGLLVLGVVGLVALIPVIQWLGQVNDAFPFPDWLREFEQLQMELIEQVLSQNLGLVFSLSVLGLTPALCEELLFRGYVQRQAERSMGVVWGIVFTGVLFGLYHLRLTQAVPLSVLGIYLCYLTWRTGSLWPAIVVHFLNNGFAVVLGAFIASSETLEMSDLEEFEMPWYFVFGGVIVVGAVIYALNQRAQKLLADRPRPVDPPRPVD
jgi:membrane protease YdiL (CAAX protease family)